MHSYFTVQIILDEFFHLMKSFSNHKKKPLEFFPYDYNIKYFFISSRKKKKTYKTHRHYLLFGLTKKLKSKAHFVVYQIVYECFLYALKVWDETS